MFSGYVLNSIKLALISIYEGRQFFISVFCLSWWQYCLALSKTRNETIVFPFHIPPVEKISVARGVKTKLVMVLNKLYKP